MNEVISYTIRLEHICEDKKIPSINKIILFKNISLLKDYRFTINIVYFNLICRFVSCMINIKKI